ncbi:hypothetical protein VTJ04DRAFT_1389 [Mycothermus thermophilus]|uniref:uncharacterized protein n=1 Tax=Humicola insolens TaxID=85995 RepID=UPI003742D79E
MLLRQAPPPAIDGGDPDFLVAMGSAPAATTTTGIPIPTNDVHMDTHTDNNNYNNNNLDDVWGSPDDHHHHHHQESYYSHERRREQEPSDLPRLRQEHHTAGYRDGIALAKSRAAQPGFDEGYPLGAELGARAGELLGVLEGLAAAVGLVGLSSSSFSSSSRTSPSSTSGSISTTARHDGRRRIGEGGGGGREAEEEDEAGRLNRLLAEARQELGRPQAVFAASYFDPADGTWRYDVSGSGSGMSEERIVFADVAEAHPLLRKWQGIVGREVERYGVDLDIFRNQEQGVEEMDEDEEDDARTKQVKDSRPVARREGNGALAW